MNARTTIDSPIGPLHLAASSLGLTNLAFSTSKEWKQRAAIGVSDKEAPDASAAAVLEEAVRQVGEYFAGKRTRFDLPLDLHGTDFQVRVWRQIAAVPHGQVISYGELAIAAGAPGASRAAGAACGANPVAIIVPCHRVVGADGSLHGFGGGLDVKAWLLRHEGAKVQIESASQPALAPV